ncbi:glycoside hydrolase family 9 protein [Paenibacillus gansuensis]|uniref:Glycoside hydrolase family 9 protein n=1 Tax=Paenibacillus gansuensis TaxID=306542 RepID=A0ABW5PJZ0_9BACL
MKYTKWTVLRLIMAAMLVSVMSPFGAAAGPLPVSAREEGPAPDWNRLQDLQILYDKKGGQWSGAGDGFEIEYDEKDGNGWLPFDPDAAYEGLPSYKVNVSGAGGWWTVLLAHNNWATYDLNPYWKNGYLEFYVKGAAGGESFKVGLRDKVYGRHPEEQETQISIDHYVNVTTNWQHVKIPLKDLVPDPEKFSLLQNRLVTLGPDGSEGLQFWVNQIRFTSPDPEVSYPAVKVNQVGYTVGAEKYALVTGFPDALKAGKETTFQLVDALSGDKVYSGKLKLITEYDRYVSGEKVLKADFSRIRKPGQYYVKVEAEGIEASPRFHIGNDIYDRLLVDSARYFYYQRQGIPLEPQHAGMFARGNGTPADSAAKFKSDDTRTLDASGGWFDAGDYGKYTNAVALTVNDLLWAYELFPSQFGDGSNIPESGNGIPDLLDEIRWGTDFLLKLQDTDGGVYMKVAPSYEKAADQVTEDRYIYDVNGDRTDVKPTAHTADAAGALAHASKLFSAFDPAYSTQLLSAAKKAWGYLEENGEVFATESEGAYPDGSDKDNRLYAAASLFRTTGEAPYSSYFAAHYDGYGPSFSATENGYGITRMELPGFLHYIHAGNPDPAVIKWWNRHYSKFEAAQVDRAKHLPWHTTHDDGRSGSEHDFYWGNNKDVLNTVIVLTAAARSKYGKSSKDALLAARHNLNYMLGINPLRFSYVSGYGEDSLSAVFSNQFSYGGTRRVPPGILTGGPNAYDAGHYSRFPGKAFRDVNSDWTVNEPTIYWVSNLVFVAAFAAEMAEENE